VQEEPDARMRQSFAQAHREQQQLLVVDPNGIVGTVMGADGVAERFVRVLLSLPAGRVDRDTVDQVMKQPPEHPVREAMVVPIDLVARHVHRHEGPCIEFAIEIPALLSGAP
jgi:hypothetical protein